MMWPAFQSDFLNMIVLSIKKRSKSIKHKVKGYTLTKAIEVDDDSEMEKLEIEFRQNTNNASVRIYFWDDRWLWIDIREPSKTGWAFEWSKEGRVGANDPGTIRSAIEYTIQASKALNTESIKDFEECWGSIALAGPVRN